MPRNRQDISNRKPKMEYPIQWLAVSVCLVLFSTNVYAIPSPDLVINLSASIAQLLGLVSVLFGGFAISSKKRGKNKKQSKIGKTSGILFLVTLVLFLASLGANLLQYTNTIDIKNARLHTNLVRKSIENGKTVGNTSLKTLSFSNQQTHELGVSTDTLAKWLDSDTPINIIDVRENAEIEGGMIEGAQHIRYPDLLSHPDLIPDTGNNNLLLCYSGNRSSELCEALSKQGKSCNFMIGGYEKWLTESRPLNMSESLPSGELRNTPDYKNKHVLLDTPDVHKLVQEENAEFIDVRYPQEFVLGHLPGAHNITMRALSTQSLEEKLKQTPDVPLIAACYDKRSCFYSQLIGLSLTRIGRDFRGRYTVPHEYYLPSSERSHVANWKAENQQATLLSMATAPLTGLLDWLTSRSGHYVTGILLLVLLVRFSLLPLTIKAERDQIVLKSLKPALEKIKQTYSEHPRAQSSATLKLYRENKIKPVFNMVASFAQLGLLLLFYSVVNSAASGWTQQFLWIQSPAAMDPLYVLPALVTVLFAFIITKQIGSISRKKAVFLSIGGLAFFALIQSLSAAVNIYLTLSMIILIAQDSLIQRLSLHFNWDGKNQKINTPPVDDGLIPLRYSHLVPGTGKKAARLGELIEAGYNVPDGFVLTDVVTQKLKSHTGSAVVSGEFLSTAETRKLRKLWLRLRAEKVAVRSSGLNEDGADTSFAGVYDSILNVSQWELFSAIRQVFMSLDSDVADSYNNAVNSIDDNPTCTSNLGGVVIQKMVDAEYAGVMFTEHPVNAGAMLVEVVAGLGEDLVSGTVTPDSYSFGKVSRTTLDDQECPIDLQHLLQLGCELEKKYEHPQDIEWAYAGGKFYLLQTRNITRSICNKISTSGYSESERSRLLKMVGNSKSDKPVYIQNELSELLPTPTPLSASFMQSLWASGGSTDLACQRLGIPYDVNIDSDEFVTTVFGSTYINKVEEKLRLGKGPGAMAAFNLARNADAIEKEFKEYFLPSLLKSVSVNHALDYSKLTISEMVNTLEIRLNHFVSETYVEAEIINIAADYYWKTADAKLSQNGKDPAKYLNYVPRTIVSDAISLVTQKNVDKSDIESFLDTFGHRSPYDYELSMPRYADDPSLLLNLMNGQGHNQNRDCLPLLPEKKLLRISVDRVHRFQALKEEAKHYCLLELNEIRKLILAMDQSCKLDGDIFQLTLDEVLLLNTTKGLDSAKRVINRRKQQSQAWSKLSPPATLSIQDLESMDVTTGNVNRELSEDKLAGKYVAGDGSVKGIVRVIHSVEEIDKFQEGEILVARMTDPQWYPLFPKARGIVTEVGGWLSHAAIVAREHNLPAVVGVVDACNRLNTGDIVELNSDGTLAQFQDQRGADSVLRHKERTAIQEKTDLPKNGLNIIRLTTEAPSNKKPGPEFDNNLMLPAKRAKHYRKDKKYNQGRR